MKYEINMKYEIKYEIYKLSLKKKSLQYLIKFLFKHQPLYFKILTYVKELNI